MWPKEVSLDLPCKVKKNWWRIWQSKSGSSSFWSSLLPLLRLIQELWIQCDADHRFSHDFMLKKEPLWGISPSLPPSSSLANPLSLFAPQDILHWPVQSYLVEVYSFPKMVFCSQLPLTWATPSNTPKEPTLFSCCLQYLHTKTVNLNLIIKRKIIFSKFLLFL